MYLHLGQGVVVPEADIIGVFDLDNTTGSHITRKFLGDAEKAGKVISVSSELPNSFVICSEDQSIRRKAKTKATPTTSRAQRSQKKGAGSGGEGSWESGMKIYLSQLSSQTLFKRSGTMRFE